MPHKFNSFADIHRALEMRSAATKRHTHSLDHMRELLEFLGNPEKRLKVVHVAGTSGKTSTAYYVAALLKEAGREVGLTISPHVEEINERVQIGLEPLPEAEFCARFGRFYEAIKDSRVVPNYFELFMTFAIWEFAQRGMEYAVIETGIGGLLDSTNVMEDPDKVCVITDIGYDHMPLLGETLPEIAAHKAGIIHRGNAVFCNLQDPEVMEVIRSQAERKHADLHTLKSHGLGEDFDFLPLFQRRNFGLALEVAEFVLRRDGQPPLKKGKILRAAYTSIPGRMETFKLGGKTVIVDIAHNSQKLRALLESVHDKYPGSDVAALVRIPRRDSAPAYADASLKEVIKGVNHIIFTGLSEEGDAPDETFHPKRMADICRQAGFDSLDTIADPVEAFEALKHRAEPVLLVTGSTFLLNHIRPLVARRLVTST